MYSQDLEHLVLLDVTQSSFILLGTMKDKRREKERGSYVYVLSFMYMYMYMCMSNHTVLYMHMYATCMYLEYGMFECCIIEHGT